MKTISVLAFAWAVAVFAANSVYAQNPPPPNVNPGSQKSGAEETGAPNQPRSGSETQGTGSGVAVQPPVKQDDGVKGNVNPGSVKSGSEPAGEPAGQKRY